jgi:hypothetical protein
MQDGHVKIATVRHLEEMADAATENMRLRDSGIGWPLQELWVTGELLEGPESMEWGSVVLVLDLPPDELTWLARHPMAEWISSQLRLGKRPFAWAYRPSAWPVWNHRNRRLADWRRDHKGHDESPEDHLWRAAQAVGEMEQALSELGPNEPGAAHGT